MNVYLDAIEVGLCRTIGCSSLFARWFVWPHSQVCTRFVEWRYPWARKGVFKEGTRRASENVLVELRDKKQKEPR